MGNGILRDMNAPRAAANDLAWLLQSAPLLNSGHPSFAGRICQFSESEQQAIARWLATVTAAPDDLNTFVAKSSAAPLRLGRYAERLLEFFLRHGPTHRLTAANIPIRNDSAARAIADHTTRGEIDFLLQDAAGEHWHWELAVKYFLCTAKGPVAQADDFVGPDRAETLRSKLTKLIDRQLVQTPPAPYTDRIWQPAAFTRGWIFYRHGALPAKCDWLADDHARGWWLPFEALADLPEGGYQILERSRWLARAASDQQAALLDRAKLRAQLLARWQSALPRLPGAAMVAQMRQTGQGWQETARGFVLPPANVGQSAI
jgi:uncharacterized protein